MEQKQMCLFCIKSLVFVGNVCEHPHEHVECIFTLEI